MKTLIFLALLLSNISLFSQDSEIGKLDTLFKENKFDEILTIKTKLNEETLTANSLYIIGIAYFDRKSYHEAIEYFDKAIKKGPEESKMYYFLIQSFKHLKQFDKALTLTEEVLIKYPEKRSYPTEKAEILFELGKNEEAVKVLEESIGNNTYLGKTFYILSDYYYEKADHKRALEILYSGKNKIEKDDEHYGAITYNIYLIEYESGEYLKSKIQILELISNDPENYNLLPPIIQNYFALQMYDSAVIYQKKLYEAHKNGQLEGKLSKRYCFERFKWNDKWVHAYEDYYVPDPEKDIRFHKQVYVILDKDWNEEFTVQTELFLTFKPGAGVIYVIGAGKYEGDEYLHQTYSTLVLKEPVDYKKLKESVLMVLDGKVDPVTQSRSKKKK